RESLIIGQNILFVGPCGTGKDHLMHAMAWRCFAPLDGSVTIVNGSSLRRDLRSASQEGGETHIIKRLVDTSLLCLSDPVPPSGDAVLTGYQADCLYQIVDSRWRKRRPIWATINLPIGDMRQAAGQILSLPVWDRLIDGALILACNWHSYRRPNAIIGGNV
ncbi:MAG: ATP-binding protein, partial [Planctomycetaceae bacterium]|nr:ATP-binding protein [Planctomycetaceae bacterium]